MRRFKSHGQAQRFLAVHSQAHNLFRIGRHLLRAVDYRMIQRAIILNMAAGDVCLLNVQVLQVLDLIQETDHIY